MSKYILIKMKRTGIMNLDSFKWLNKSEISVDGDKITITAPPATDFFNSPVPENGAFPAPQGSISDRSRWST
jgi:hypothetical protein